MSDTCQYKHCGKDISNMSVTRKYCTNHIYKENTRNVYNVWNCILKCNDGYVLVLREILIDCSSVFKAVLEGNKDNIIELDYPSNVIYNIMYALHSTPGNQYEFDVSIQGEIKLLCKFAHQYDIKNLNNSVEISLVECAKYVTGQEIMELIYLWMDTAHEYKLDLAERLTQYIVNFNIVRNWMEQDKKNSYKLMEYHKNIIECILGPRPRQDSESDQESDEENE